MAQVNSYPTETERGRTWEWVTVTVTRSVSYNQIGNEWTASHMAKDGRTEHKATRVDLERAMKAACFDKMVIRKFMHVVTGVDVIEEDTMNEIADLAAEKGGQT